MEMQRLQWWRKGSINREKVFATFVKFGKIFAALVNFVLVFLQCQSAFVKFEKGFWRLANIANIFRSFANI
jgi:hypothetical protein